MLLTIKLIFVPLENRFSTVPTRPTIIVKTVQNTLGFGHFLPQRRGGKYTNGETKGRHYLKSQRRIVVFGTMNFLRLHRVFDGCLLSSLTGCGIRLKKKEDFVSSVIFLRSHGGFLL